MTHWPAQDVGTPRGRQAQFCTSSSRSYAWQGASPAKTSTNLPPSGNWLLPELGRGNAAEPVRSSEPASADCSEAQGERLACVTEGNAGNSEGVGCVSVLAGSAVGARRARLRLFADDLMAPWCLEERRHAMVLLLLAHQEQHCASSCLLLASHPLDCLCCVLPNTGFIDVMKS